MMATTTSGPGQQILEELNGGGAAGQAPGGGVFSDFCQAWVSRFPGSELPAAWEEDVRANLKKHKTKVSLLREELEKEEMYVEYLDKLLVDIERHRRKQEEVRMTSTSNHNKSSSNSQQQQQQQPGRRRSHEEKLSSNKQQFLDDHLEHYTSTKDRKTKSLNLDLSKAVADSSTFVTVINVSSPGGPGKAGEASGKVDSGSRGSLNSVSSPTTPTSPMLTSSTEDFLPREALLTPKDPLTKLGTAPGDDNLSSSSEEALEAVSAGRRGRPDGIDHQPAASTASAAPVAPPPKSDKIKALMKNWEHQTHHLHHHLHHQQQQHHPAHDSDGGSSSRGRMGSPSGKSHHDSSDGETLPRARTSPAAARRKLPGSSETRLDRLVRRPSTGTDAKPRPGGLMAKPKPMPRTKVPSVEEPLYDTVANDDDDVDFDAAVEDEYDNHLLYGTHSSRKTDGSSSADLGFDEDPLTPSQPSPSTQLLQSATSGFSLSSSDGGGGGADSPSLRRGISVDEEQNYVNIQYFLMRPNGTADKAHLASGSGSGSRSGTLDRMEVIHSDDEADLLPPKPPPVPSGPPPPVPGGGSAPSASDAERLVMYKCILNSILDSEAMYLEGLSVMLQYMKAMKVTLSTPQPVIPKDDFETIFYKVPDLHELHLTFHENLKKQVERWNGVDCVGQNFKMLASRTKIYAAFLNNYQKALEALHRCTATYPKFADLTRSIKLRSVKGQRQGQSLSLEDLLHKPVARVQKHCLCLKDLIKYTPESHPDYVSLNEALNQVQDFVNEYNTVHAGELFPHQERQQRHLVKNSFIVELSEGVRKLRHLFLFNDVLVCAKYKASSKKAENFTFQIKWCIPLWSALIVEEPSSEPKENSPANMVALKTQTAALRDQIHRLDKEEDWKSGRKTSTSSQHGHHSKSTEKHRKKLAELEAQLVLASPGLLFQVAHKHQNRAYSFFLSSEYERSQWVETLHVLQSSLTQQSKPPSLNMGELQNWITSCRKFLKTNMGSFLMRSPRDEPLLVGDLHFTVNNLQGLTRPADLFVVVEVDSYGHYFRKSKTQVSSGKLEPNWEENFIIELEGSENLRILVYEQQPGAGNALRGRATLELSRTWLTGQAAEQRISMNDLVLTCTMKYVAFEATLRRVPAAKSSGLFGAPISTCTRREKRAVPFIVTSCVREVERRGITEVGIYRVSGSAADVSRLKKAYESNPYEAEQLLKECDIHSVAGTLKLYLRDLPESLFTSQIYQKMFEAYQDPDHDRRKQTYLSLFSQVPQNPNQACLVFLIEHMVRISQYEAQNKMSPHNLATVFGPTLLHAAQDRGSTKGVKADELATGTVDVMAQAGILHFFITRRARGEPIQIAERQV